MRLETWLLFAAASLVMGLIPGPGVTTIVGHALSKGRRAALTAVTGAALGSAISMSLSLAGAGALLAASDVAFNVLKWAGAIYLITLGILTIRATFDGRQEQQQPAPGRATFWGTFLVMIFNPKTLVFFVAFVPGFIAKNAPFVPQAALLVATYTIIVCLTDIGYAFVASSAASLFRGSRFARWTKRIGGGSLIGAGIATALVRAN
jgi:threonine/homoserine/homoserine lactone efflux protein